MAKFPHLQFPIKIEGIYKTAGGGPKPSKQTLENKENREGHGRYLKESIETIRTDWEELRSDKKSELTPLPNETDIPIFLKIDKNAFKIESLINWGIDVVSEEDEGYIIGASFDNLEEFESKIKQFVDATGKYKDTASKVLEVVSDSSWRLNLVQSPLKESWDQIQDTAFYTVEIGVACSGVNPKDFPKRDDYNSSEDFADKVKDYYAYTESLYLARDEKQLTRENEIEEYIKFYGGSLIDIWDNEVDAIFFKITITGKGLKDLVYSYQYLYKASLPPAFEITASEISLAIGTEVELIPPRPDSPFVCVIDSGIQEEHPLLVAAIDRQSSKSYIIGDPTTADYVKNTGHGTSVAGAILFPLNIPTSGSYELIARIQNARILDANNQIPNEHFAPLLMEQIVIDFPEARVFNLSVTDKYSYNGTHMSELGQSIDKIIHEQDKLFIISSGNITANDIQGYFNVGIEYPNYLSDKLCRIANPAVSYFSLTVGSVGNFDYDKDDYKAIAGRTRVSPFSRTGFGMWKSIKPEVVEFGGDYLVNKTNRQQILPHTDVNPELINSTLHQPQLFGRDKVGTSFSAPKVSHIISRLLMEHPQETCLMYKTLVIQSARLPEHCFNNPDTEDIMHYGYGIPDVDRALNNAPQRVTFIQSGEVLPRHADLYRINIPKELIGEKDFVLLLEVTCCFTSETRVTRQGAHRYVGGWTEWVTSKKMEGFESFRSRTLEYLDNSGAEEEPPLNEESYDQFNWVIHPNPKWGNIKINRNNSSSQKSWAIIRPHELTDDFSVGVIGHIGWDKNPEIPIEYSLAVSFEVLSGEVNVYSLMAEAQISAEIELEAEF